MAGGVGNLDGLRDEIAARWGVTFSIEYEFNHVNRAFFFSKLHILLVLENATPRRSIHEMRGKLSEAAEREAGHREARQRLR